MQRIFKNTTTVFFGMLLVFSATKAPIPEETADTMNGYSLSQFGSFEKEWHLVTSRYRKDTGEMRLTWANDIAWKALQEKSTDYPDGAVFAKIGMMTEDDPDFTSSAVPSGVKRYQFMVRDRKKFPDTQGWGYAIFNGSGKNTSKPEDHAIDSRACSACHEMVPQRGYVFSQPMALALNTAAPILSEATGNITFTTLDSAKLRADVQKHLPAGTRQVRRVHGPFEKHVFVGTMGEIRPVLIREAIRTRHPALLISDDSPLFSLSYINPDKPACEDHGKKGVSVVSLFTTGRPDGQLPPVARNEYCETAQ